MLRAEVFDPARHWASLGRYMQRRAPANNSSPKILRLADYDGIKGDLFLILDADDEIRATSAVVIEPTRAGPAAKIYGRLHIESGVPHSLIDRHFEPMTFQWCLQRKIEHLFLTVNQGNLRVLDWVARRIGERRASRRPNEFTPEIGPQFRAGFVPLNRLIFERHCWQYVIYCSPQGKWFLDRKQSDLDPAAIEIFKREFPTVTQNWP